jgi:hypothetical protein
MYLRWNRRFKDGKEHRYWSIVESRRCAAGKIVQRQVCDNLNIHLSESVVRLIARAKEDLDQLIRCGKV